MDYYWGQHSFSYLLYENNCKEDTEETIRLYPYFIIGEQDDSSYFIRTINSIDDESELLTTENGDTLRIHQWSSYKIIFDGILNPFTPVE
jgi:hypothetical protein